MSTSAQSYAAAKRQVWKAAKNFPPTGGRSVTPDLTERHARPEPIELGGAKNPVSNERDIEHGGCSRAHTGVSVTRQIPRLQSKHDKLNETLEGSCRAEKSQDLIE